ncbi:MAG: prolyl oligopeptidase family serine peptidase [Myxococcota bacterium]
MRTQTCLALAAALGACRTPPTATPPSLPQALADLNAEARQGAVVETLHGTEVADPYRALETESELTLRWIRAQSEFAASSIPVEQAAVRRLDELLRIGDVRDVDGARDRVFYRERSGDREQPLYKVRETDAAHTLIDPTTFGERAALDWAYPSPTGRYVAFGISQNGDERSTLHLLDVDARIQGDDAPVRPLRIAHTKWCNLAWLHDESGFYYTRYPKPGEDDYDEENEDTYFPRVFFHALGTDPSEDPRAFASDTGTDFPIPYVSPSDDFLVINVFRGWSATDVFLHARADGAVPTGTPRAIVRGEEAITTARVRGDDLVFYTNLDAPNYRLVAAPIASADNRESWQDLVPEGSAPIEDWTFAGDALVIHYVDNVASKLVVRSADGTTTDVELPTRGSIENLSGSADDPRVRFAFSGYLQPPSILELNGTSLSELVRVRVDIDFSAYAIRQERVRSADGTEVPVTLLHRRDAALDGDAPVILYGYGGFNISLLPSLRRNALYWLEQGGVYAVATLRGGGEFGESWHRAGMQDNKERVFEDFEAIIQWLGGESGISNPGRIGITGGSNGGLLMGAMITRVPERFAAAAAYVGLYDMVRYHRFPPAELWVSEYGSADDADQFAYLHAYSPYHRVRETAYPAVLIETADHDSRVHWAHSTKFAARLQDATTSQNPVYFLRAEAQGHGAGTRVSDQVEKLARMYAFFQTHLAGNTALR